MIGGRRPRGARWLISEVEGHPGLVTVTRNGREILAAVPMDVASAYLRKRRRRGDRAQVEESDGYRRQA